MYRLKFRVGDTVTYLGWARDGLVGFNLYSPSLGTRVYQMPFYARLYLNLLIGRVVHVTSDRLHEQQISPRNECP